MFSEKNLGLGQLHSTLVNDTATAMTGLQMQPHMCSQLDMWKLSNQMCTQHDRFSGYTRNMKFQRKLSIEL